MDVRPPRYYLVNDAQKAAIAQCLRRRLRLIVPVAVAAGVLVALAALAALMSAGIRLPASVALPLGIAAAILPLAIIPHVYLVRAVGPLVAGLPRSEQRFPLREQFSGIAAATPAGS